MAQTSFVALLRGINVGGHNKIPMLELRGLCADFGWQNVESYVQSGNLIFHADASREEVEAELESGVRSRFGLSVPVIARTAEEWSAFASSNPFAKASKEDSKLVMLALSKAPLLPKAAEELRERAAVGERIEQVRDALWIHYTAGVARSKLSPGLLDRAAGSPVTTRNWNTVLKLDALLGAKGPDIRLQGTRRRA